MIYTVYRTTNILNNKYYIGVHKTKIANDDYLGSGTYLKRAIKKYGREFFKKEILHICIDHDAAYLLEAKLITKETLADRKCYNIKLGGEGGFDYINRFPLLRDNRTPASLTKGAITSTAAKKQRCIDDPEYDRFTKQKHRDEYYKRQAVTDNFSFQGQHHTDDTKILLSEIAKMRTGDKNSSWGTMWITDGKSNSKIKKDQMIPEGWYRGRILTKGN